MKFAGVSQSQKTKRERGVTPPLSLVLFASLLSGLVVPTPTLGGIDKLVSDVCAKSSDAAFRAKYCSAAKSLKSGYNASIASSAVWTGVSVACGAACGKTMGGIYCKVANTAGSAGEGLLTKKFADSLKSEGSKWGGQALGGGNSTANNAGTDSTTASTDAPPADTGGKVNGDACQTAGESALKAYGKYSDSKQTTKSLTDLKDQTKGMNSPTNQGQFTFTPDSSLSATQSAATAGTASDTCSDAAIGTALGAIRCAASKDPSLPPYAKSEEFLKDLQKATGNSPDAFFAGFENPAKSIVDSPIAAGLSEGQQKGLADSLSAMEGYSDAHLGKIASNSPSESYLANGTTHTPEGADTSIDINGMIAGALGQINGAGDGTNGDGNSASGSLDINRKPASNANAAEDRKISIFDRVQWRYGAISARDRLGGI